MWVPLILYIGPVHIWEAENLLRFLNSTFLFFPKSLCPQKKTHEHNGLGRYPTLVSKNNLRRAHFEEREIEWIFLTYLSVSQSISNPNMVLKYMKGNGRMGMNWIDINN